MKAKRLFGQIRYRQLGLSYKDLRMIERKLGVYFDQPKFPLRTPMEQFGVFDEDEVWVGDICTNSTLFDQRELEAKTLAVFAQYERRLHF